MPWITSTVLREVARLARGTKDAIAHALCLPYHGQSLDVMSVVRGAHGAAPVGGERTWRVRQLPGDLVTIVCPGICEPPSNAVGTWSKGQPAWPCETGTGWQRKVTAAEERERIAL